MKPHDWFFRPAAVGCWLISALSGLAQTAPATPPAISAPAATPTEKPPALKDAAGRTLRRAPTGHITNYYEDMASNYGYQFAGNFQKYIGHWNDMPGEAHLLISLSAPRPVFISAGSGDLWSDPRGQFLATVAAGPVWRLLGQADLGTTEMPPLDTPVATGALAYLEHDGPHVISPLDWKIFLEFADRHLGNTKKTPGR